MKLNLLKRLFITAFFVLPVNALAQGVLTFEDVMKFENISTSKISDHGNWLIYGVWPDRGDGHVVAQSVNDSATFRIDLGSDPHISSNEQWVAAAREVPLAVQLKEKKKAPKPGMSLLSLGMDQLLSSTAFQLLSFRIMENGWCIKSFKPKKSKI